MTNKARARQSGAVSIFIVLFAALLITVITVSFSRNMIREQQQATAVDLSQSAFDSAQAGVEDAKRVLLRWQAACKNGGPLCSQLNSAMQTGDCNTVSRILYGQDPADMGETKIEATSGDNSIDLDQAYTCVTIDTKTDDYQGKLEAEGSNLIRLSGVGQFNYIQLSWFSERDLSSDAGFSLDNDTSLPAAGDWGGKPPIMRTQFIKADSSFLLDDFDGDGSKTLHLYPVRSGLTSFGFASDPRQEEKRIQNVDCQESSETLSSPYYCVVEIELPGMVNTNEDAFLRLVAHYNAAHYEVKLFNGTPATGSLVQFDGVQPKVDSTGRANDLFRRVVSRIELTDPAFPYPEAAVRTGGDFCKQFTVTNRLDDYTSGGECEP